MVRNAMNIYSTYSYYIVKVVKLLTVLAMICQTLKDSKQFTFKKYSITQMGAIQSISIDLTYHQSEDIKYDTSSKSF